MALAKTTAMSFPLAALTAAGILLVMDEVTVAPPDVNLEVREVAGGTTLATE